MAGKKKYTDAELIAKLKSRSADGLAPPTSDDMSFYYTVKNRIGWQKACELAGVKPRNKKGERKPRYKRAGNDRTEALAKILHIGHSYGHIDITTSIDYVRRG